MSATFDDERTRYAAFVQALTEASRRYGVAVQSVGGVTIADSPDEFAALSYAADITSGDLLPDWDALVTAPSTGPRR